MSMALSTLLDTQLGGVLLANMLADWLEREAGDELEDHRAAPEQTRIHLCAPVESRPSTPPSGEYGAAVCAPREGRGTRLEPSRHSHARPGPRSFGRADDGARRFQDLGGRCLYGSSRGGVCFGGLPSGPLESRLASITGAVCAHPDLGNRRRWLLRPG